jgi:hypothetical protein
MKEEPMNKMGRYCKAYPVDRLREFSGWEPNLENTRKENGAPRPLSDGDFLYLQENLTVTDGIFLDENVIFDSVTPAWATFCKEMLHFELPDYEA